jgi:hypothetical protein
MNHLAAMGRHIVHWTVLTVASLAIWAALGIGLFLLFANGGSGG